VGSILGSAQHSSDKTDNEVPAKSIFLVLGFCCKNGALMLLRTRAKFFVFFAQRLGPDLVLVPGKT